MEALTESILFYLFVLTFVLWFYKAMTTALHAVAIREDSNIAAFIALILGIGLIFLNPLALMLAVERIALEANITLNFSYWFYFLVMLLVNVLLANVTEDARNIAENM